MQRILRFLLTLAGLALGTGVALAIKQGLDHFNIILIPVYQNIILFIICGLAFGILLFFLSPGIIKHFFAFLNWAEGKLIEVPMPDILSGSVGLIVGLVIAFLISDPISRMKLPWVSVILTIAI